MKRKAKTVRQRLAQQRPELEARRQVNWNTMRERQRRSLAHNLQSLHDRYLTEGHVKSHMDTLRPGRDHIREVRALLEGMNAYTDPWGGLPAY